MSFTQDVIKYVSPFMRKNGYSRKGKCFYYIRNNLAFCVEIDYAGHLLYVTYYFIPLYIPTLRRYYTYGNRLNSHPKSKLPYLNQDSSAEQIQYWSEEFKCEHEQLVAPFFDAVSCPHKLVDYLRSDFEKDVYVHCPEIQINRLLAYSYSYLHNQQEFSRQASLMHRSIRSCTFLSPKILNNYMDELSLLTMLNESSWDTVDEYYASVINKTQAACF